MAKLEFIVLLDDEPCDWMYATTKEEIKECVDYWKKKGRDTDRVDVYHLGDKVFDGTLGFLGI